MKNFWKELNKKKNPFFCLAPMADVTDGVFRQMVVKYGKPDVLFTEMVACDGLCSSKGQEKLLKILKFSSNEKPIVAQLFGSCPKNFYQSAQLIRQLGFDGIDINMGCPQKNILKQKAGADLINHPQLAQEIIRATKQGAGGLPVSVKTRIGFNRNELKKWLPVLLGGKPAVITLHGRTKKEMSKVPAHWDVIKEGVILARNSGVLIVGNGDVKNLEEGRRRAEESGVAGIMVGRAILGKPWLLNNLAPRVPKREKQLEILKEHLGLFERHYGGEKRSKNFALMKKHIKAYLSGLERTKELRIKLMKCENKQEVLKTIDDLASKLYKL